MPGLMKTPGCSIPGWAFWEVCGKRRNLRARKTLALASPGPAGGLAGSMLQPLQAGKNLTVAQRDQYRRSQETNTLPH